MSTLWLVLLKYNCCECCCSGSLCCDNCRCLFSSWQMHTVSSPAAVRLQFDMCPSYKLAVLNWWCVNEAHCSGRRPCAADKLTGISKVVNTSVCLFWNAPLICFVWSWHSCFSYYFLCCFLLCPPIQKCPALKNFLLIHTLLCSDGSNFILHKTLLYSCIIPW